MSNPNGSLSMHGLRIAQILQRGGAFRADHEFASEGQKWRYWFVLNHDPKAGGDIALVTTTTKVYKTLNRVGVNYVYHLTPELYPPLDKACVINCMAIDVWPYHEVVAKISQRHAMVLPPLAEEHVDAVVAKILLSTEPSQDAKKLLVSEEDLDR